MEESLDIFGIDTLDTLPIDLLETFQQDTVQKQVTE